MRINNETGERAACGLEEVSLGRSAQSARDEALLTELSRANNEVLTAQRELAKKCSLVQTNAALEEANVRLDALATMDVLTGVKNRRALADTLAVEVARSQRYGAPPRWCSSMSITQAVQRAYGHQAATRR